MKTHYTVYACWPNKRCSIMHCNSRSIAFARRKANLAAGAIISFAKINK